MKLLALAILIASAGAAYAALQPGNTFDGREQIGSRQVSGALVSKIQYYTPPVMLYGQPIPPDENAQLPNWYELEG